MPDTTTPRTRRRSRWAVRRQGEAIGYLTRHPLATAETIAEHYKRDPRQVRDDLDALEADGEVVGFEDIEPGLLGAAFPIVLWPLTDKGRP